MGTSLKFRRSLASIMAVGALATSGLVIAPTVTSIAPEAHAAIAYQLPSQLIDANRKGNITIFKRLNPNALQDPTGKVSSRVTDDTGVAVLGVEFTVYRVNDVDLSTHEKYAEAAKLTVAEAEEKGLTEVAKVTTEKKVGAAQARSLPVGLYLVKETDTSKATLADGTPVEGQIIPAAPFLVYLPMTDQKGTMWNYSPQVMPKNSTVTVEKTVEDKRPFAEYENRGEHPLAPADTLYTDAGEDISYTITTDIPAGGVTEYKVVDKLDTEKLTFKDMVPSIGDTKLEKETDYTLTTDPNPTVTFTEAGMKKLSDARKAGKDTKVKTVVTATVKAFGGGDVKNTGSLITNGHESESNEVVTKYGALNIFKYTGEDKKPLKGAKFKLHLCRADGTYIYNYPVSGVGKGSAPGLTINGAAEWESDENGKITIDGIHVTDFANNAVDEDGFQYCLVESQAPEGYELRPDPIMITFKSSDLTAGESATGTPLAAQKSVEVENISSVAPKLPATGGMGIGILMAIGAAVIGVGVWFARRSRS
ncbi:SpaH/EbpB family LPXTG-anchored major pilin [Corynebacterium uropygiale]|uniref:SpaH/EbpB family LPXTG-anchored major pilin n=1 Tax=Corynebacterium uropygiale TaxID=1775911 RepID=A0A9X1TZE9_9CORY|nr:SpaH/EbpB family LPXTG-anchored major pilin [Corynebacterium uropygiale]MCF4006816.1 SpaH/EbpB family LPXTG-anchored major pilin [Corynebacterium uropygiale]